MFFKKIEQVKLTKLYFSCEEEFGTVFSKLLVYLIDQLDVEIRSISWNYKDYNSLAKVMNMMGNKEREDMENLFISDSSDITPIEIAPKFLYFDLKPPLYEINIANRKFIDSYSFEKNIIKDLMGTVNIIYGYSRILDINYDTGTETKIKKGLLGGISIRVDPERQNWLMNPEDIYAGAIKGFYPLNYWTPVSLAKIMEAYNKLEVINEAKDSLYELTQEQIDILKQNYSVDRKFFKFDGK